MGHKVNIMTSAMQCIGGWMAEAAGAAKGGVVVVQEIYGVNAYVRGVVEDLGAAGFSAIAPAFFDHVERDVELDYTPQGTRRGMALASDLDFDRVVEDIGSAAESIASAGRVACVGFCWGGTAAFLAATRLGMPAVSFYGSRNVRFLDEPTRASVMFHFGARDRHIPQAAIARHRDEVRGAIIHTYADAGHGFHCNARADHDAAAAALAWRRTLDFLTEQLADA